MWAQTYHMQRKKNRKREIKKKPSQAETFTEYTFSITWNYFGFSERTSLMQKLVVKNALVSFNFFRSFRHLFVKEIFPLL